MSETVGRVLVVGGTGLLGYHAGLEFLRRGYGVATLSIDDIDLAGWFPSRIEVIHGDVFAMTGDALVSVMEGFDAMVYAVGPDDRTVPTRPAEAFFRERLVENCTRVFASARKAGIRRAVLLSSYFTHFDRLWPSLALPLRHTYIGARVEQAREAVRVSRPGMDTMVLELPYIFGTMPNRVPLWKEVFLVRLLKMNPVFYPGGGSAMIRVENVAEAIAGAVERGEHGFRYAIGDQNIRWKEMLDIMFRAVGTRRRILPLPVWIASLAGMVMMRKEQRRGREPGLNMKYIFRDIISREFFIDPRSSMAALGYGRGDVREAIALSARACFPSGYPTNRRKNGT